AGLPRVRHAGRGWPGAEGTGGRLVRAGPAVLPGHHAGDGGWLGVGARSGSAGLRHPALRRPGLRRPGLPHPGLLPPAGGVMPTRDAGPLAARSSGHRLWAAVAVVLLTATVVLFWPAAGAVAAPGPGAVAAPGLGAPALPSLDGQCTTQEWQNPGRWND